MDEGNEVAVVVPQDFGLALARDPRVILAEAQRAAKALKDVIGAKEKKVVMNGKQYLEFEDWQTCGKFYNVAAKIVSTEATEYGSARGFIARAVAINTATGQEISAAEAMCLNDEEKWSTRAKYEYPNGVKTKVGEVPVPAFQLRSMAQTRACAKALRNCLAWVVVLAGYAPTPAEDMTGDEEDGHPKKETIKPAQPKAASEAPADAITEQQAKRFYAKAKGAGKSDDEIKDYLALTFSVSRTGHIPKARYDEACAWADKKTGVGDAQ